MVAAIKHFKYYLCGRPFTVRTDHSALQWLMSFREPDGQVIRWIETLQSYVFTVVHRAGASHGNTDALSRRPWEGASTVSGEKCLRESSVSRRRHAPCTRGPDQSAAECRWLTRPSGRHNRSRTWTYNWCDSGLRQNRDQPRRK